MPLTYYERKVLIFIISLILFGAVLKWLNVNNLYNPSATSQNTFSKIDTPININKASLKDLEKIPGIGKKIAQRIIQYRLRFGEFKKLDDLKKVKGIGKKRLEKIKPFISL
jgi:comEA protein